VDPVVVLSVTVVAAGSLLVAAGAALWRERQPDDPDYTPAHARGHVRDELERAVSDDRRALRRHPAPWAAPRPKPLIVTVTKPLEETPVDNLPDVVYKTFWTVVALALGYLTTVAAPDVGPTWTPLLAAVWTPVLVALRTYVDKRTGTPAA